MVKKNLHQLVEHVLEMSRNIYHDKKINALWSHLPIILVCFTRWVCIGFPHIRQAFDGIEFNNNNNNRNGERRYCYMMYHGWFILILYVI